MRIAMLVPVVFIFLTQQSWGKTLAGIYPDMREFKLEKPASCHPLQLSDLKIDVERIRKLPQLRPMPGDREKLLKIAEFYRDNPDGIKAWNTQNSVHVLRCVNNWELPQTFLPAYQMRWIHLRPIIDTYFFTGNPVVGKFVHDYTMHAMTLGKWFWMGQTYRSYLKENGKWRHADLQTLPFAQILNLILADCRELFSPDELKLIESKYREYVLESCYEDLLRRQKWPANNWNAILGGALLLSAEYFNDQPKADFARKLLKNFFRNRFEDDGSYGEGFGYGNYATSVIPIIYPYLTSEERNDFFQGSPLRNFPTWLLYHDFCNSKRFYRAAFGDDNYFGLASAGTMYVLALQFPDSAAAYLGSKSPWRKPWWNLNPDMLLIGGGKNPPIHSPEELNLPLVAKFANGEAFIRSGWKTEDAVFSSFLVQPCRVNSHKRPESGNFVFGCNGVPLVMHSGNTNLYRRPIHRLSIRTSAANTVTIDGQDQLAPQKQNAQYLELKEDKDMVLLRCDLRSAYSQPMRKMVRTFAWLKKTKQLVVMDEMKAEKGEFEFKARLHLNDIFHHTELRHNADGSLFYRHPDASLYLETSGNAKATKSYVVSEQFSNWDEIRQQKEADSGNAWQITYGPEKKTNSAVIFAVLGETRAQVKLLKDGLGIDGLFIPFL